MRCSKAQHYIDLSLDGELKARHQKHLRQHLATCKVCPAWQTQAVKLQHMLANAPQVEVPAWVHANIMDKVHRLDKQRPSFVNRFKLAPATATLAIIISFWVGAQIGSKSFTNETDTNITQSTTLLSSNNIVFGENSLIDSYEATGESNE
ncbi:MAG: zf-HC2 domain-containing protein [Candidatus Cloacimonas sp.]|jgi:anti-sigma factor RsiW|nr:zf-HC2 domain-containing protein [Candidatus Cloacimonas sp.]